MPYFTHEGHRLHYREQGSGRPLLILPGDTSSAAHHSGELAHFEDHYHSVSLDFRGTGRSDRIETWPADWWEICVEDTAALVRHLGEGPAILVGQSAGAAISLMLAIRHPDLVRAVISDSQVEYLPDWWLREMVARRRVPSPSAKLFWQVAHGEDWPQVVAEDDAAMLARADAGGIDWFHGRLAEIKCPVLLMGSLADDLMPNLPAQIITVARQIPECSVYFCATGAHALMWTRPEHFRRAADCFLAALPS